MFLTALIMGVAGSLHCAGMCSPLAMTVTNLNASVVTNRVLYNLGRITTYGILGAITATVGYLFPISQFQNVLSLTLGLVLVIMAAMGTTGVRIPYFTSVVIKFTNLLKTVFARTLHRKNTASLLLLGSLNGFLPCGLTFLALSFCVTLPTPIEGFAFMFTFGIGTLPIMLGLVSIVALIKNKMNWNVKHLTTGLMLLSGIILIARVFVVHELGGPEHDLNAVDIVICR